MTFYVGASEEETHKIWVWLQELQGKRHLANVEFNIVDSLQVLLEPFRVVFINRMFEHYLATVKGVSYRRIRQKYHI